MPQTPLNQRGPASSATQSPGLRPTPLSIAGVTGEVNRQQVASFFPVASHFWLGAAGSRGRQGGCVAKTRRGTHWPGGSPFLLGLGRHSKEAGDEGDLPGDVSLGHSVHLSFANHVHGLISVQGALCTLERKEAQPRLD
jgi:hypothetical protein